MALVATGSASLAKREKFAPASKFIAAVEYDPVAKTMDVMFKSGTKTRYLEVYPTTYLSFKQSPTFDSFYARAIKGNLQSVKLIDGGIGTQKSSPLKKVHDRRTLDAGIRKQQRTIGTVNRAFESTATAR